MAKDELRQLGFRKVEFASTEPDCSMVRAPQAKELTVTGSDPAAGTSVDSVDTIAVTEP